MMIQIKTHGRYKIFKKLFSTSKRYVISDGEQMIEFSNLRQADKWIKEKINV